MKYDILDYTTLYYTTLCYTTLHRTILLLHYTAQEKASELQGRLRGIWESHERAEAEPDRSIMCTYVYIYIYMYIYIYDCT